MSRCPGCGARVAGGSNCQYCGALLICEDSLDLERERLDELHETLLAIEDLDARVVVLTQAPIPSHPRALIDAGLRGVALLEDEAGYQPYQVAVRKRVSVVISRLRILPVSREIQAVISELDAAIDEHVEEAERDERTDLFLGCGILGVALAACGGITWVVYYFG